MFLLRRPTDDGIRRWLARQSSARPGTGPAPPHATLDHHRATLGSGGATFDRARAAVRRWDMFRLGWVELHPAAPPLRVGTTVAVVVRHLGVWSLNPCRIVRLVEERGAVERFGFAYRTLPEHAVDGEEEFVVEWSRADDAVAYDLRAWSRPRHPLARLARPLARRVQRRFARDSMRAMQRAVAAPPGG
jgi:uncharacterized protein (UPF0548 family)